jgi:hypothetical protein
MSRLVLRHSALETPINHLKVLLTVALFVAVCGCGFKFEDNAQIRPAATSLKPAHRIAVMPFYNSSQLADAGEIARGAFFNALLTRHYEAVDTDLLDSALAQVGVDYGKNPLNAAPSVLKDKIPADALLYGEVLEFSKSYWTVYSHIKLRLRVALFDLATGEEIFSDDAQIWNRRVSPPMSLPGIIFSSLETLWHLREVQKYETFREIAHRVLAEMPELSPVVSSGTRFIKSIRVVVPRKTLVAGDTVEVYVAASPGESAYFDLGHIRRKIPLLETSPGAYSGRYQIQPGDNAEYCVIEACILNSQNVALSALNSKAVFAVDTAAPKPPEIVNYFTTRNSVILVLKKPQDADLEALNIFRSGNGGEMTWIGKTNEATFEDDDVQPSTRYEYVAEAVDRVGNKSRSLKPFEVWLPMRGPITVDEDFTHDVTLTAFGAPYHFQRVVRIAPNVTVRIQPGVELYFEQDAGLSISGRLVAEGRPDDPIRFTGARGWRGLYLNGEAGGSRVVVRNASFRAADCAVILENGMGELNDIEFAGNATGIAIAGSSDATLRRCIVRKNQCGINLASGSLNVEDCNFNGNKIGLQIFPERIIVGNEDKENLSFKYTTLSPAAAR